MLTEQQKNDIRKMSGKYTYRAIADKIGSSIYFVPKLVHEEKLPVNARHHQARSYDITERQEQILLGGILGDGSFKKNGKNYYYRECHATPEAEYLKWKFEEFGEITTGRIHDIPRRVATQNAQVGFQTRNSPSILPYVLMPRIEVIHKLKDLGLIVWMLDDGWCRHNCKKCCFGVSAAAFSQDEIGAILDKMNEYGLDGHTIGKKQDISLPSKNNKAIKEIAYRYFPKTMDIIKKKINPLIG